MTEFLIFLAGGITATLFVIFFDWLLGEKNTDARTIPEDDDPNPPLPPLPPLPPGAIFVPSAEGKRARYEWVNSQEELDETLALAREALTRQRKRVRDNNLGTPEDLGFDTPTGRL